MTADADLICWETRAFLAVLRENISLKYVQINNFFSIPNEFK